MLQREVVRFRAAENQPNPLEVDYWIDITANRYGGIIKYYRNDTLTWEVIESNPELLKQMIAELKEWVESEINRLENDVTVIEGDISTLQTDMTAIKNRVSSLESTVRSLSTSITSLQSALNNHINRRDNPHVVTRAQLGLATSDNVVFNKVSAPAGFWKE